MNNERQTTYNTIVTNNKITKQWQPRTAHQQQQIIYTYTKKTNNNKQTNKQQPNKQVQTNKQTTKKQINKQ